MMFPDSDSNNNMALVHNKPSKISLSATANKKNQQKASDEDDEKWQHLTDTHHELCDLRKCLGKRINGLYVCQFSNIPGSQYSQYLRHRRRLGAFKTKPCRNYYGSGYCHAGDNCSFYHSGEEQRKMPDDADSNMLMMYHKYGSELSLNGGNHHYNNGGGGGGNFNNNFHIGHFQASLQNGGAAAVDYSSDESLNNMLDSLCHQLEVGKQKLRDQVVANSEFIHLCTPNFVPRSPAVFNGADEVLRSGAGDKAIFVNNNNNKENGKGSFPRFSRAVGSYIYSDNIAQNQPPMDNNNASMVNNNAANGGGGGAGGKPRSGSVGHNKQQQQAAMVFDMGFGKSFHPFSESYPLKNLSNTNTTSSTDQI